MKFYIFSFFVIDFYPVILFLDFFVNTNPNRVIFYFANLCWSKHTKISHFSLQFIV